MSQFQGAIDTLDKDLLGWWCAERQTPTGGLNGRPEKLPDVLLADCGGFILRLQVCYSWWVLSAMAIMRRLDWIDGTALTRFILSAQVAQLPALSLTLQTGSRRWRNRRPPGGRGGLVPYILRRGRW